MKGVLSFIGFATVAAVSGTVVYLYVNDPAVKDQVNKAIASVGTAVQQIKSSLQQHKEQQAQEQETAFERNRAWVDEQWDALGI